MAWSLVILLLPTLLSQVFCLQCNSCEGEYDCFGQNVTCEGPSASCTTSVRKASISFLEFQTVKKGCSSQLFPQESISLNSHLMSLSYQARYCVGDGCNNETYFVSHPHPVNHMRCHSCASQGPWCPEAARTQISCVGNQDQCMDLVITGNMGYFSNMRLKGCASLPRCQDTLSFYSGSRTIHANCCDTPLCNSFTPDLHVQSQASNGLECYSCVDEDASGSGCSSKTMSKVQCTGIHNMCLEGIGNSRKGGKDVGSMTFKGCASPAMCQSSLLALVQELDNAEVMCCQGNLCNSRIVNGVVTEPKVAADSADISEAPECISLTPTASGPTPNPDCVYEDEEEDVVAVAPIPAGVVPPPDSPSYKEVAHTVNEMEGSDKLVTEGSWAYPSPHHDHSATGEHIVYENLPAGSSEGHTASPTSMTNFEHIATGSSSAAADLERSDSGAGTTSSGNHGSVVVLVPIIVPKMNTTAAATFSSSSSSSAETTEKTSKEVLAASNNDDSEEEECEADEDFVSTGQNFIGAHADNTASPESNHEGLSSTNTTIGVHENDFTRVPGRDNMNAGIVNTGGHSDGTTASTSHGSSHTVHSHGTAGENFLGDGTTASHTPLPGHSVTGNHGSSSVGATGGENFVGDSNAPQPDHTSSGSSAGHAANTVLPVPYLMTRDNESFISEDTTVEAGGSAATNANTLVATSQPAGEVLVSGAAASTSRPKKKIPCKRPGSQNKPGASLVSPSGAESRIAKEDVPRGTTNLILGDIKNPGKVNPGSGAFGLTANLGLFSLTLLMATLLH